MRTTILAYVIAFLGLLMIGGGYLGSFGFIETPDADTNSNQTLRNGNWNDMRRRWHRRYCAGFAPSSLDCAHDTAALKSVVAHDKARFLFFDRPGRREAARRHSLFICSWPAAGGADPDIGHRIRVFSRPDAL